MRIAVLVPNFSNFSGDARVVELQAEDFSKEGNEVTIFAFDADITPKTSKLVLMGMPKNSLLERVYRLFYPIDIISTIKWLPKFREYDLIVSHLYPMNWLAFLAKKIYHVNYTYWYHGIPDPKFYPKMHEKIYLKIFIFMTKLTASNADRIVSVSNAAKKEFKEYTGKDSEIVYNKPNNIRFHDAVDGFDIRKKYGMLDDPVFLNVGRVCPQKGAHLLIEAFSFIKQKIPNAKLVVVGKHTHDYYSNMLKEKSDDSVIFTGYVSDEELPLYYAMSDVYVSCSLWETFNIPLTEAQECGKPVVVFDIGPHSEVINEHGILVETGNLQEFANACINKYNEIRGDSIE